MGAAASSRRRPSCKQACHQLSGPIQLFWKGQELLPLAASPRSDPGRRCRGRRLRLLGWSQLPLLGPGATLASCPCVRRPPPSFLCKEEGGWTGLCPDSCFCHLPGLPTWHCSPPRPPIPGHVPLLPGSSLQSHSTYIPFAPKQPKNVASSCLAWWEPPLALASLPSLPVLSLRLPFMTLCCSHSAFPLTPQTPRGVSVFAGAAPLPRGLCPCPSAW